jgi:hypothetical protein
MATLLTMAYLPIMYDNDQPVTTPVVMPGQSAAQAAGTTQS